MLTIFNISSSEFLELSVREPAMAANAHEILALAASHDVYVGLCVGGLEELAVREVRAALRLPAGRVAALDSGYDVVLVGEAHKLMRKRTLKHLIKS